MERFRSNLLALTGALAVFTVMLVSCGGGGGYGGGGGGGMGLAPAAFDLSFPPDLATSVTTTPTLTWTASLYAGDYLVEIDTMNTFPAPVVSADVVAPTMSFTVPGGTLTLGTPYFWRVTARNAYGHNDCRSAVIHAVRSGHGHPWAPFRL